MAQKTVGHVVAALADSFTAGLECYTEWRQKQRRRNKYQTREMTPGSETTCAASASLANSKLRIEEAFSNGADVLGDEFISGDAVCRDVLLENLSRLQECIEVLEIAVGIENLPLPLYELVRVSETVRESSVTALHKQYQRIVVGRLAPRALSPTPTHTVSLPVEDHSMEELCREIDIEIAQTRGDRHSTSSETTFCDNSNDNCESLSPPSTLIQVSKERLDHDDDLLSTYSQSPTSFDSRPRNSVFSIFCPEAVKYQVDVEKTLPSQGTRCRCGYDWNAAKDITTITIKDGFQITPRFMGKSHCENGLGCVLCTSSGEIKTFDSVGDLKAHINSSHTKWQLLHDRDLTGR